MGGVSMQLQSSYIFLPNPYNKKPAQWENERGELHIDVGRSVYAYLKRAFPNMKSEGINGAFFQYKYSFCIEIRKKSVDISIISKNVVDSYFINIIAEGKTKFQLVEALDNVQKMLFATEIDMDYISIVSYDAVSEYYCNQLYPKLNKLERNLRKLLFNIYVLNFGREYYQATTSKELQDKAKGIIRAKGDIAKRETAFIKQFFYSLEYTDIQQLLFAPRWTNIDEEHRKSFLAGHKDLSKLSDTELRAAIENISPKSDWDRFFYNKFQGINIEEDIEAVRVIRNNVAHCKFLKKEQYVSCNSKIIALNEGINKAIEITEDKDFADKNKEYLNETLSGISSRIQELVAALNESALHSLQRFQEIFRGASLYYAENLQGAMEATRTLSKALSEKIKSNFSIGSPEDEATDIMQSPESDL